MTDLFPQEPRRLAIAPRGGAIGSEVTVAMVGATPKASIRIAFANLQAYELIHTVVTDADGNFTTTIKVPDWALPDQVHYMFANPGNGKPRAFSDGFHVTAADGTAHVEGTLGSEVEGCVEMKNADGVLYNLVGDLPEVSPGDHVAVVGTIANAASCGGQGVAIAVTDISILPR